MDNQPDEPGTSAPPRLDRQAAAYASSSTAPELASYASLQTWVYRPQAVTKCFVSDVYRMRALLPADPTAQRFAPRDVFLLNHWPCKVVELVGWVAGVDDRESSLTVYFDDGDGEHMLPLTVRLQLVKARGTSSNPDSTSSTLAAAPVTSAHFVSAKERKLARAAAARAAAEEAELAKPRTKAKVYDRKDIGVGDTVRVIGKVEEYARQRDGALEWVRTVTVEEQSGGSIEAVPADAQYLHAAEVAQLHDTVYCRPFTPPQATQPPKSRSAATASQATYTPMTPSLNNGWDMSSDMPSEITLDGDRPVLRAPSELRSSQLTDRTFRQYLLDHITQDVVSTMHAARLGGTAAVEAVLRDVFPELAAPIRRVNSANPSTPNRVLLPSSTYNANHGSPSSTPTTPTQRSYMSTCRASRLRLEPFTLESILAVEHLRELAELVVDHEAKREERNRRRRIRDGTARKADMDLERERVSLGRKPDDYKLGAREKRRNMQRLAGWAIRSLAEEGGMVQVRLPASTPVKSASAPHSPSPLGTMRRAVSTEYGYLPLPPEVLMPLLVPHLQLEQARRSRVFMKRDDPRRNRGMTEQELTAAMRSWGSDGRWERLGEWAVAEALEWGEGTLSQRHGEGWWALDINAESL